MSEVPQIKYLQVPKWLYTVALFALLIIFSIGVFNLRLGSIFNRDAEAQESGWNKFGVNTAVPVEWLYEDEIRRTATLVGNGGSIVGIVENAGQAGSVQRFISTAQKYCLTPVLRLEAKKEDDPASWGNLFSQVSGVDWGKVVISIGNEVNGKFEWTKSAEDFGRYLSSAYDSIKGAVPSATVIGPPLNTTAPEGACDDLAGNNSSSDWIYWKAFARVANEAANGVWNKMDGHASVIYPFGEMTGNWRGYSIEKSYLESLPGNTGYSSKSVYGLETGLQKKGQEGYVTTKGFYQAGMSVWKNDPDVVMVNFFNALGHNGTFVDGWMFVFAGDEFLNYQENFGAVSNPSVKYSSGDSCEVVTLEEYEPYRKPVTEGLAGTCLVEMQNKLSPIKNEFCTDAFCLANITVKGCQSVIGAKLTIADVAVANHIQEIHKMEYGVDGNGDAVGFSLPNMIYNAFDYDPYNEVKEFYPADGTYIMEADVSALYWSQGNNEDQGIVGQGEFETKEVSGLGMYSRSFNFDTQEGWVYFPFGSALGQIGINPYNIFRPAVIYEEFEVDSPVAYSNSFVGGQSVEMNYIDRWIETKSSAIASFLRKVFDLIKVWTNLDNLETGKSISIEDGNGLVSTSLYKGDYNSGESGVDLGYMTMDYKCAALELTYGDGYIKKFAELDAEKESAQSAYNYCLVSSGGDPTVCEGAAEQVEKVDEKIEKHKDTRQDLREMIDDFQTGSTIPVNIDGEMDLTAPFIPILAESRIWMAIRTGGRPICTTAMKEIRSAKVIGDVKFYDLLSGNDFLVCSAGEQLTNGNMENFGGSPGGTAAGTTPAGWNAFWKKGGDGYSKAPEFKPHFWAEPDKRRVLEGNASASFFSYYSKHDVVLWQKVEGGGELVAYSQMWRQPENAVGTCPISSADTDSFTQVCVFNGGEEELKALPGYPEIEPGAFDSIVNGMRCSSQLTEKDVWVKHSLNISAGDIVILRSFAAWEYPHNDTYWDGVTVCSGGLTDGQPNKQTNEVPESGFDYSVCSVMQRDFEEKCELTGGVGTTYGEPIHTVDVEFAVPGLGALPEMAYFTTMVMVSPYTPEAEVDYQEYPVGMICPFDEYVAYAIAKHYPDYARNYLEFLYPGYLYEEAINNILPE